MDENRRKQAASCVLVGLIPQRAHGRQFRRDNRKWNLATKLNDKDFDQG